MSSDEFKFSDGSSLPSTTSSVGSTGVSFPSIAFKQLFSPAPNVPSSKYDEVMGRHLDDIAEYFNTANLKRLIWKFARFFISALLFNGALVLLGLLTNISTQSAVSTIGELLGTVFMFAVIIFVAIAILQDTIINKRAETLHWLYQYHSRFNSRRKL